MKMTHSIACSLGLDVANRQMRKAGRIAWNEEAAALAAASFNQHFPLCAQLLGVEPEKCGCLKCASLRSGTGQ